MYLVIIRAQLVLQYTMMARTVVAMRFMMQRHSLYYEVMFAGHFVNASPPPFLFSSVLCYSVHLLAVAGWQQAPFSAGSHPEELDDGAGAQTQVAASTAVSHL